MLQDNSGFLSHSDSRIFLIFTANACASRRQLGCRGRERVIVTGSNITTAEEDGAKSGGTYRPADIEKWGFAMQRIANFLRRRPGGG